MLAAAKEEHTDGPLDFYPKGPSNAVTLIGNQIPVFHIQSVAIVTDYTVIYDT